MTTKKSTTKGTGGKAPAHKPTSAGHRAAQHADLAQKLAAVLTHPALPPSLRQDFYEAINELQNMIDLNKLCYSEAALRHTFDLYGEEEKGAGE